MEKRLKTMENDGKTVEWWSASDGKAMGNDGKVMGQGGKSGGGVMDRRLESDGKVVEE